MTEEQQLNTFYKLLKNLNLHAKLIERYHRECKDKIERKRYKDILSAISKRMEITYCKINKILAINQSFKADL